MALYSSGTYDLNMLIPSFLSDWDDYSTRLQRYEVYDGYYHNIAYHSIVSYSQSLKTLERLYKHVRGVYNPVMRLVELYVAKVYGGELDTENAEYGAIPIETDNPGLREAIAQLWRNSRWGEKKSVYVRNGARFGDSYIKIIDDMARGMVYMETVDPRKIKTVDTAPNGTVERVVIEYLIYRNDKWCMYTEIITPDKYKTMLDGELYAFNTNARGEPVAEWDNEYGFVPFVHVMHRDTGLAYGANAYYGTLHKINELNDLASILNDAARKQAQMPLVFKNARVSSLDFGSDQSDNTDNTADKPRKDTVTTLNITGDNADVMPIPPVLDLSGGLANIQAVLEEIERDLPELSLHRIRDGGNLTAPGVTTAWSDGASRIREARGNYDTSLVEAQRMAVAIGGMRGYSGFAGFNLASLDTGAVNHQIAQRPVIQEVLSTTEQVTLTLQAMTSNAPSSVYYKLGWNESAVEEFEAKQALETNIFMSSQLNPPPAPDIDETPQDAERAVRERRVNETTLLDAQRLLEEA